MPKFFTYIRKNENNLKYTQEQIESIEKYVNKHNINIYKNIEIVISTSSEEKNILELLKN